MSQYVNGRRTVAFERVSKAKIRSDLRAAAKRLGEPLVIKRYREQAPKRGWASDSQRRTGSGPGPPPVGPPG